MMFMLQAQRTHLQNAVLSVFFFSWTLACAQEKVAHQQPEREANHILYTLRQSGIDAEKKRDEESRDLRFDVLVPATEIENAVAVLEKHNLPKSPLRGTQALFEEGGMIPTRQQELAKRIAGIENDIANSLIGLPRIVDVKVSVSIPEEDPLRDPNEIRPRPKASVIIVYQADAALGLPIATENVQQFAQAKLPELRPQEVSVAFMPNTPNSEAAPQGTANTGGVQIVGLNPEEACNKSRLFGIEVCAHEQKRLLMRMVGLAVAVGFASIITLIAILRALRYRKDLTRLTAQFEQARG